MNRSEIIARAIELDDPHGDDRCPGCGRFIAGWEHHWAHYPPGVNTAGRANGNVRTRPFPWLPSASRIGSGPTPCPWDRDMLTARAFRRALIRDAALNTAGAA